jgi:trehalose utilization protein
VIPALLLAALQAILVHDDPKPMEALAAPLRHAGYAVTLDSTLPEGARADVVFMYVHGALDAGLEARLIRYAEEGGRLIVLHHGAASGKMPAARWMPFLGLRILPRDAPAGAWDVLRGNCQLVNLNPGHYVSSYGVGWDRAAEYTPSDGPSTAQRLPALDLAATEYFLNQHFTDGREKTVLFGMKIESGGKAVMQDRGGWLKPAGKGHVFYFQPGHQAADFEHPGFARILVNAARWRPGVRPRRPVVAVDAYHNLEAQPHYRWEGTYPGGYSRLGELLTGMGAELRTVSTRITASALRGVDCLITADPDTPEEAAAPHYFAPDEVRAIAAWVRAGGKLALLGNNPGNAEFTHFNRLAAAFGMEFVETTLKTPQGHGRLTLETPGGDPVLPRRARFYAVDVAPVKLKGPGARPLLRYGGSVVMAMATVGRGAVLALGDPWIYNEYIDTADNRALASDVFRYLLF